MLVPVRASAAARAAWARLGVDGTLEHAVHEQLMGGRVEGDGRTAHVHGPGWVAVCRRKPAGWIIDRLTGLPE